MIFKGSSSFHWVQCVIFNLFDHGNFASWLKRMVSLSEVVTDTEGIGYAVYVFSVVIESYIEGCFRFSDILLPAFKAVH